MRHLTDWLILKRRCRLLSDDEIAEEQTEGAMALSKKDKKTGAYIPDTVTVKCGKITKNIKVIVEE